MPWRISSAMSQRHEFVMLAGQEKANVRQLCRQFGISSATAYKWLHRFQAHGIQGLQELSRRPQRSPARTAEEIEKAVIAQRQQHPAWGARKLRARLLALGHTHLPSPSTITSILHRHQLVTKEEGLKRKALIRFEHPHPNDLWQMDFKGDFALGPGRCYPLTVLDDHSRFAVGLVACPNQRTETTRTALIEIFRRYGLPWRMTMDNGAPWASYQQGRSCYTDFSVWLIRLGIRLSFSRPHHPQTQGKDERFHRTLGIELLRDRHWVNQHDCQRAFEKWRAQYNLIRPHEALGLAVPASRYRVSARSFPETLLPIEYDHHEIVRKVGKRGQVKYQNRKFFLGNAFAGLCIALRPTNTDGLLHVFFGHQRVGSINIKQVPMDH
ncbi:MAG TPA: IS481 family transposase [Pyrinomonadaceae bacterium]|nr:IS481 family transposase [Pyrinomonadaceae bacterium]